MTKTTESTLPPGWVKASLSDACEKITDGSHGTPEYVDEGYPFVTISDLGADGIDFSSSKRIAKSDFDELRGNCNPREGDVLFSKDGTVGKVLEIDFNKDFIVLSSIAILRPRRDLLLPSYLRLLLQSHLVLSQASSLTTGTALTRIILRNLRTVQIPIPPLAEQRRIVDKIEELIAALDAGARALRDAGSSLNPYEQSILVSAFNGSLTEHWRASNRGIAKANIHPKPDLQDHFPSIPSGWMISKVEDLCEMIQYGTSEKATGNESGVPVIRMGNIQHGEIRFDDLKYFPRDWPVVTEFLLRGGDVLFNRTNSAKLVGKTAVYRDSHPKAVFASYLIRLRLRKDVCEPSFLSYYINSPYGRRYISSVVSQQVGQANVNSTKLKNMYVPCPSILEQRAIVREIDGRVELSKSIRRTVEGEIARNSRLRSSILTTAFAGRLAEQSENEQPAKELLARIRKERATLTKAAKGSKKNLK